MEAVFLPSEIVFFNESFILANGNGFSVNYKLCAFIQSFYSELLRSIFKEEHLDFCRHSCDWKQLFPISGNGVFIKSFITASVYGFWVNFKLNAFISELFFPAGGKH